MKAIVITRPGSPEVLEWLERQAPEPGPGEVLVKVFAAGINRPDIAQRKGHYPAPAGAPPDIPGLEIAGTVVQAGASCTRWRAGDQVCALVSGGGYAELCTVPEGQCLPIPSGLSFAEAASLPEAVFTVWHNVFQRGNLKPGESLLVHGGSSGIGVTAIQMARAFGATVFVTAGGDEKCAFCERLGADRAINYKTTPFKGELRMLTAGKGVNVILDMVGGDYTNNNLESLAEDGRLVLINYMKGEETAIRLSSIIRRRLTITGSTLRARDVGFKSGLTSQVEKNVWPLLASGKIKPVVFRSLPVEKAGEAHALMETSQHMGKIVLTLNT